MVEDERDGHRQRDRPCEESDAHSHHKICGGALTQEK